MFPCITKNPIILKQFPSNATIVLNGTTAIARNTTVFLCSTTDPLHNTTILARTTNPKVVPQCCCFCYFERQYGVQGRSGRIDRARHQKTHPGTSSTFQVWWTLYKVDFLWPSQRRINQSSCIWPDAKTTVPNSLPLKGRWGGSAGKTTGRPAHSELAPWHSNSHPAKCWMEGRRTPPLQLWLYIVLNRFKTTWNTWTLCKNFLCHGRMPCVSKSSRRLPTW